MKRFLVFLLVFMCCLPFVYGRQRTVMANWHAALTCAQANDFHINMDLLSNNNRIPYLYNQWTHDLSGATTWYMNGIAINQDGANPIIWHGSLDFKTANGGLIFAGDIIHFGVSFRLEDFSQIRPRLAWWTLNGAFVCPARLIGFHIWPRFPFWEIATLYNDTEEVAVLQQLEFAVTPFEVPLEEMFSTGLGDPGKPGNYSQINWKQINEPITIGPGKSVDIDLGAYGILPKTDEYIQFRAYVNGIPQWWQSQE
ncbi:MAG TPA: hypothetical protein VK469_03710 [Candidatus Kapabacteria bacterium]|nr:hypothetical protein [Candidatus Kapabacteria bacterium]